MNRKPETSSADQTTTSTETSSTQALIEKVKAQIQQKPTPQLIVLLRALEKTLEAEKTEEQETLPPGWSPEK